ncbi:UNKNOWN [Stylonychia lemnae]|uniref:VTT domain-containing protein n=1 Tax=Stylonychia lemnae TaxID=5949 RepID=A0A078B8H3_STYLE|nr:UNKNOWN [Stylonychia lemnae]|eukprot:CDW89592.1 UNKNOWN [Stylonychia lemnae]
MSSNSVSLANDRAHNRDGIHDQDSQSWLELIPQIIFILFIIFLVIFAAYDRNQIVDQFNQFVEWVKIEPLLSGLAIFGIYVCLVVFAFPILYMTIALGFAFSQAFESRYLAFAFGLTMITFSVIFGGVIALLLSRHWLSKTIKKRCLAKHRSFIAINHVITKDGWKTVFLLRLTPFPFSVVSYLLGLTNLRVRDFVMGSLIVSIHIALWLYIGQSIDHFKQIRDQNMAEGGKSPNAQFQFYFLMAEILIAFIVGFVISYKAKKELDRQVELDREEEEIELRRFDQQNQYDMEQNATPQIHNHRKI